LKKTQTSIRELILPYKWFFVGNILSNVLVAVFTLVSIPILKPFFDVLFDQVAAPEQTIDPDDLGYGNMMDYINSQLYHFVEDQGRAQALLWVCLFIVASFLLKNIFRYLSLVCMAFMRTGVVRDLRDRIFYHLLQKPLGFYKEERKGNLLTIMSSDVMEFESSVLSVLEIIIRSPLIVIGSLGYMLYVSPTLTLYVLLLMIFTAVVIGGMSRRLKRQSRSAQDLVGSALSVTEEAVYGIKTIRAFHAQDYVRHLFSVFNEGFRQLNNKILFRRDLASPMSEFLGVSVVTLLLWLGSTQVFSGVLEASTFLTFIYAFYNIIEPAKSFSTAYYNYQKGMGAFSRIQGLLESEEEDQLSSGKEKLDQLEEGIKLQEISYRYPGENEDVLKNIDLYIPAGQRLAIVGASGSGKTTLVDLICRFQKPVSGNIYFDQLDIRDISESSFRTLISIVSQEPVLFHDSIRNNICLSDQNQDEERIIEACKKANVWDFVKDLDQGLDTVIGEAGSKLSGGQRQRIVLARALYFDTPILILDEATSALDSQSEDIVQRAIEKLGEDKTIIIIAHRLQTIRNVDKILVLDNGQIVEAGKHDELMATRGIYSRFVELQSF